MRHPRLSSTHFVAAAVVIAGVLAPMAVFGQAQPPAQAPAQAPTQAPTPVLGPYKPVPITLPSGVNDASFDTFRKQLGEIANNKDRAALARLVAANFFWVPEDKDIADKQKSGIDNLAKALSLDGTDGFGWEALAAYAAETTVMADPQRKGVFCVPVEPVFDEKAADELANVTHTDAADSSSASIWCAFCPTTRPPTRCSRPSPRCSPRAVRSATCRSIPSCPSAASNCATSRTEAPGRSQASSAASRIIRRLTGSRELARGRGPRRRSLAA